MPVWYYFGNYEFKFMQFTVKIFFGIGYRACGPRFALQPFKPKLCSSQLLRPEKPCCNALFAILILNIFMNMPAVQNCSKFAFRLGFSTLATMSAAQSGLKLTL